MKLPVLAVAAALFVTASLARADYSYKEPFSETHPFNARGEVTLSNVNGSVVIRTWERADVKIEGEKSAKTEEELKLIGLAIDAQSDALTVKTEFPKRPGGWGCRSACTWPSAPIRRICIREPMAPPSAPARITTSASSAPSWPS